MVISPHHQAFSYFNTISTGNFILKCPTENKSAFMCNRFLSIIMSFRPLEPFDLSWWMLDFVRLWDDTGGITRILCSRSICGRCSFHYQLSWSFSGKGQTARPQIGTWGVWFLACALQNEIFLLLNFIIIKAESSETKQNHDTAAEKMSDKCSYALVSKLLDFIWLSLMTLTTWHSAWQIALRNIFHFSGWTQLSCQIKSATYIPMNYVWNAQMT